jgi:flagellar protein FliJ
MKKFQYRLDKVLDVRRMKEEQEQVKYQAHTRKVRAIEDRIQENQETQVRELAERTQELQSALDVLAWKRRLAYAEYISVVIAGLKVNLEQAEKERVAQRELLLEALKRRKVLETLKEKARLQFNCDEELKERLELDEWAAIHRQPSKKQLTP